MKAKCACGHFASAFGDVGSTVGSKVFVRCCPDVGDSCRSVVADSCRFPSVSCSRSARFICFKLALELVRQNGVVSVALGEDCRRSRKGCKDGFGAEAEEAPVACCSFTFEEERRSFGDTGSRAVFKDFRISLTAKLAEFVERPTTLRPTAAWGVCCFDFDEESNLMADPVGGTRDMVESHSLRPTSDSLLTF